MPNILYFGDNLDVMRQHLAEESVNLVYLDPLFNSARNYNVLFKQARKDENQAQITAFTDNLGGPPPATGDLIRFTPAKRKLVRE